MDRFTEAYNRTRQIMETLNSLGFDINDPYSIDSLDLPKEIYYEMGATRLVVWDNTYDDYVVKIALSDDCEKYCVHEVELYHAAVKAGLEAQFGWCEEIYCYGERSVYAMEFLDCDYEETDSQAYKWDYNRYCSSNGLDPNEEENLRAYSREHWGSVNEDTLIEWFEDKLLKPVAAKFDKFMSDYSISDIHPGNVAKRGNEWVLCDYAGYDWW